MPNPSLPVLRLHLHTVCFGQNHMPAGQLYYILPFICRQSVFMMELLYVGAVMIPFCAL